MNRLALKSLAARPLRTALTTLAIVLGVALVAGALTLTDTQRRAADALSSASYDGTAAVVSAKTAFRTASEDYNLEKPTVLLADEPTGNLDSTSGAEVLTLLREAVELDGQTTVMVTHDPRAAATADRVLFLADGRIVGDMAQPTEAQILAAMKEFS